MRTKALFALAVVVNGAAYALALYAEDLGGWRPVAALVGFVAGALLFDRPVRIVNAKHARTVVETLLMALLLKYREAHLIVD